MHDQTPQAGAPSPRFWETLGVVAVMPWLAARLGWFGVGLRTIMGLDADLGPFLFIDAHALWLLLPAAVWLRREITRRCAWATVAVITLTHAWIYATESLSRYYGGGASAYDLSVFIQPLWRASTGQGMPVTWTGTSPLWADHGAFGMLFFVPFTRLFSDAGTGVLLAQAALVAAWIPTVFACARALGLSRGVAMLVTVAAAASRAMHHAVVYDFHPECGMPVLLLLALWAYERGGFARMACCGVLAALLKEMAALTVGMACVYLALERRDRRCAGLAILVFGVALVDMFVLPKVTGAAPYTTMYTSGSVDYPLALATTGMRALTTMLLGWLHPLAWFAGAPWALAAGLSAKVAVKGVSFQYGFLHVPVAIAGVLRMLAAIQRRGHSVSVVALVWALATVSVNALGQRIGQDPGAAHARFQAVRNILMSPSVAPPGVSIATDACLAPYLMERATLAGLCVLSIEEFTRTGRDEWTSPSTVAFDADRIVIDTDCPSHGACIAAQLAEARKRGFRNGVRGPRLLVLLKP